MDLPSSWCESSTPEVIFNRLVRPFDRFSIPCVGVQYIDFPLRLWICMESDTFVSTKLYRRRHVFVLPKLLVIQKEAPHLGVACEKQSNRGVPLVLSIFLFPQGDRKSIAGGTQDD